MAAEQTITLFERLKQCDVLDAARLEELATLPEAQDPDPRALGRVLLRRELLTRFQINLVARGRGKDLTLGPYVLLDRLGEGGMGEVFQARHRHMQRIVALKVIRKEKLASEEAIKRFYLEARAAGQLHHPNIVTAYDAGQAGSTHYFAMEYVDGTDLSRLVRESGPLPAGQACDYARQVALGLQHAYERGLVHRDIKPANLFVSWNTAGDAVVKILDMGLARVQSAGGADKALTQTGQVMGTPDYLAPEQALDAHTADIRADLYSLGCTLYFLLTGRPPFTGDSLAQVLLKHQMADPEEPPGGWGEISTAIRAVLRKLLAKEPAKRYQTPQVLAVVLEPLCKENSAAAARPPARPQKGIDSDEGWPTLLGDEDRDAPRRRPAKRRPDESTNQPPRAKGTKKKSLRDNRRLWLIAGGVSAGVVVLLALVIGLATQRHEKPPAEPEASAAPAPEKRLIPEDPPQVAAVRREDLPPTPNPTAPEVQPQPVRIEQPPAAQPPSRVEPIPGRVASAKATIKPISQPSGLSPLDHLDVGRLSVIQRQALPPELPAVAVVTGHAYGILGMAFSPDGKRLATAGRDGIVRIWDLQGVEPRIFLEQNEKLGPLGCTTFSPDGRILAVAAPGKALLYDMGQDAARRRAAALCDFLPADGSNPCPEQILGFFPESNVLVTSRSEMKQQRSNERTLWSTLKFYSLSRGDVRLANSVSLLPGVIRALAVSPDFVVATGNAKSLHTMTFDRLGNGKGGGTGYSNLTGAVNATAFSPDGTLLAVTTSEGILAVYSSPMRTKGSIRFQRQTLTKAHDGWATVLGFTPDGQTFMTRGEDRYVAWWNTSSATRIREWQLPEGTSLWRFSPDGRYATVSLADQRIAIIRLPEPFQQP
jgi:serine/threonine protein kinase/WD40 repeat protein